VSAPRIAAGWGFASGAEPDELAGALMEALARYGVEAGLLTAVAVPAGRPRAAAEAAAARMGVPLLVVPAEAIAAAAGGTLTRSARSLAASGSPSLSEAAALAAAGPGARLMGPRVALRRATCALAEAAR
jgi:cobalt-precorrin 5A hydrolase